MKTHGDARGGEVKGKLAIGVGGRRPQAAGRSPAEIVGSNPTGGMEICLLWLSCVVR